MDWTSEFPGLRTQTYLNSCSHGLLPDRTRRAIDAHLQRWTDAPDWLPWMDEVEKARRAFAKLIHAQPDEIAVTANASQGIGAAMSALRPTPARRALLTTDIDFPTAPALAHARVLGGRGFEHRHVAWERYRDELKRGDVALACAPLVASFTGRRLPVRELAAEAHARGAMMLVDGFQAIGNVDVDVRRDDVDFLATGVYKWLMAPAGLGFLYVRRDHFDLVPTTGGWQALDEPYAFDPLGPLARDARRYQNGGPSVLGCVAASSSIDLLLEIGMPNVEARDRALVERVIALADERKYEVLTPRDARERASIVTFRVPDQQKALDACARAKVAINPRLGGLRISPHFYNREADVDRLFDALDQAPA